jgi:photosystem II stability/assembly factor-like uncharacterized protein
MTTQRNLKTKLNKLSTILSLAFMLLSTFAFGQKVDMEIFKDMKARSIGPAAMSGRITAIDVVESNPDIIYAGAASGGLWRSTGGGLNWEPLFDDQAVLGIGAVKIYQKNPDIIWVGTGEGNPRNSVSSGYGVYRSIDGGASFQLMGLEKTRNIHKIYIHPDNPNIVYVGAIGSPWGEHEERGLFKTVDGGKTWKKILFTNNLSGVADIVADPTNPDKIFVAMWEHKRWPWFFKSGGPGSGLYVTYDGGDNFKKLADKEGLPKGDYGRIGLAISHSNPNYVYAMVESSANGLYRSTDGGKSWELRAASARTQNIGDRPFYYADIHVDTKNENRVYSLFSRVSRSEDGGKNWEEIIPYSGVHPDHHAWYIHPDDPSFMVDGNDGGLNITRDMAKTWRFTEKLPVGQFYHVNVDNEMPYNVYGGMQDNGSWVGPAYVFNYAGIRNHDWQELSFGDGFDVAPIEGDSRYGYTMSQQGSVTRYDKVSGYNKNVKPTSPDTTIELRFNWNAPVALDPFDANGVYYGSQHVHYSTNRGDDWEIISPDLSTNDPEKQKQNESGGLTIDATGAENHTTLLTIAPSPVDRNVIWAGTDDGNVQVTKDKGKNWVNVAAKLPGLPTGSWIPQIKASDYNAGEAFVIANNYRRNDFSAYAYHTADYGQTWTRIVDDNDVFGFTLSILQDPIEPNLIFLGTENGLFVSFDKAQTWNKWSHGYPNASTMDLTLQKREHDLVIGTFGRAFYVLDDIRPLREFAAKGYQTVLNSDITMFDIPDAYQIIYRQPAGMRFPADGGPFEGENKYLSSANIKFWVKDEAKKEEAKEPAKKKGRNAKAEEAKPEAPAKKSPTKVKMTVLNAQGDTIRTRTANVKKGEINMISWNLDRKNPYPTVGRAGGFGRFGGFGGGGDDEPGNREQSAGDALPGTYKVVLEYGDQQVSKMVKVAMDPRMEISLSEMKANRDFEDKILMMAQKFSEISDRVRKANDIVTKVEARVKDANAEDVKDLKAAIKAVKEQLEPVQEITTGVPSSGPRGQADIRERTTTANNWIQQARQYNNSRMGTPGPNEKSLLDNAEKMMAVAIQKTNAFFNKDWPAFKATYDKANLDFFEDFSDPIKK